jgi:hypothetical protein
VIDSHFATAILAIFLNDKKTGQSITLLSNGNIKLSLCSIKLNGAEMVKLFNLTMPGTRSTGDK